MGQVIQRENILFCIHFVPIGTVSSLKLFAESLLGWLRFRYVRSSKSNPFVSTHTSRWNAQEGVPA